jgi:hypothetical protein
MSRLRFLPMVLLMIASSASAQGVCRGPSPAPGASLHGPVLEIPNGASLCIATGASPDDWIRVDVARLGVSRPQLMAAAFARNATCEIGPDGQASCTVEGQSLAQTLRQPEIVKAATAWR